MPWGDWGLLAQDAWELHSSLSSPCPYQPWKPGANDSPERGRAGTKAPLTCPQAGQTLRYSFHPGFSWDQATSLLSLTAPLPCVLRSVTASLQRSFLLSHLTRTLTSGSASVKPDLRHLLDYLADKRLLIFLDLFTLLQDNSSSQFAQD